MKNKKGLVMGVANQRSIAWGIAEVLNAEGASLALTYQGENFIKRVEPLAESIGSTLIFDVDVTDESSIDKCFNHLSKEWESLDFVVHALAFSDKSELSGRFINTSRQNFLNSLDIFLILPHQRPRVLNTAGRSLGPTKMIINAAITKYSTPPIPGNILL